MKMLASLSTFTIVASCLISQAFGQQAAGVRGEAAGNVGVEILSDTRGADIGHYMQTVISDVKEHWIPPAAQATQHGSTELAGTVITFSIRSRANDVVGASN